jgi:hypothetical protein
VRVVLDSGGISALAGPSARARARREALLDAGLWPPEVPAVVLAEALTGDPRRDHPADVLVRTCDVVDTDELTARTAARLRTASGRAGEVSAVDAVVVAVAVRDAHAARILTSDPRDVDALIAGSGRTDVASSGV